MPHADQRAVGRVEGDFADARILEQPADWPLRTSTAIRSRSA